MSLIEKTIVSLRRRELIKKILLFSSSIALQFYWLESRSSKAMSARKIKPGRTYDWILLYWMPYDNNLSRFGYPIINMLAKGVINENILVVVESDFSGAKQLTRNIITKGNIDRQLLDTANSASEEVFAEYLNWAQSHFIAKKWSIIFLGHGGNLDEVSPDNNPNPGINASTQWMNIKKLSDIIFWFNKKIDNRLELIFFQNCNKGTIETHYTFRDAAKYTLSSQLLLGAPNYYYEALLNFLGKQPEIDGGQLAEKIMEFEQDDMYFSYTVTDNRYVRELSEKLNPLIDAILADGYKDINYSKLSIYYYSEERYVDVVSLLKALSNSSKIAQEKFNIFLKFFKESMIYKFKDGGNLLSLTPEENKEFSGLGILFPRSKQHLDKYRYLPIFEDLKLIELFDMILSSRP